MYPYVIMLYYTVCVLYLYISGSVCTMRTDPLDVCFVPRLNEVHDHKHDCVIITLLCIRNDYVLVQLLNDVRRFPLDSERNEECTMLFKHE